jgi:hypothetical protein
MQWILLSSAAIVPCSFCGTLERYNELQLGMIQQDFFAHISAEPQT